MAWIKAIASELVGLFVDDGSFAASIVIWVAVVWLGLPHLGVPAAARAIVLFAGLAFILVESATRRARR